MQILAKFSRTRYAKPGNNPIDIRELNRVAAMKYSIQEWNIKAKDNEISVNEFINSPLIGTLELF